MKRLKWLLNDDNGEKNLNEKLVWIISYLAMFFVTGVIFMLFPPSDPIDDVIDWIWAVALFGMLWYNLSAILAMLILSVEGIIKKIKRRHEKQ